MLIWLSLLNIHVNVSKCYVNAMHLFYYMYYDTSNSDNKISIYKTGKGKTKKIPSPTKKPVKEGKAKGKAKGKGKKKEESPEPKPAEPEPVPQEPVKEPTPPPPTPPPQEEPPASDLESDRVRTRHSVVS